MKSESHYSDSLYKSIIDNQAEYIIRHTSDSTVLYANKAFLELSMLKPEDLIGKKWFDIAPADIVAKIKKLMSTVTPENATNHFILETDHPGDKKWISWISTGIFGNNGELFEFQVIGRDITSQKNLEKEYKKAMEELSELNEKFKTIIEFTQDMERWVSPEGELIYISPSCERITGYTREEFMNEQDLLGKIIIPEDQLKWKSRIKEFKGKHDIPELEFRIRRKDGQIITLSVASRSVFNQEGIFQGIRSSSRDISDRVKIESELKQALEEITNLKKKLQNEIIYLRNISEPNILHQGIITRSARMSSVIQKIKEIKDHDSPVLFVGEIGSGKKHLANLTHQLSSRKDNPIISIPCSSMSYQAMEQALFGFEGTDDNENPIQFSGYLEVANGSTLVLEEISLIPPDIQIKLLDFIKTNEFYCTGCKSIIRSNARIIATSIANLEDRVQKGLFNKELYHLLSDITIEVPSLRYRQEDISALTWYFLEEIGQETGRKIEFISSQSMEFLVNYTWPGNVKELKSMLESSVMGGSSNILEINLKMSPNTKPRWQKLEEIEKSYIEEVVNYTKGRISGPIGAAAILGMNDSTLRFRIKKLGVTYPK